MKLISCYIENFGGLSQYRLDFREGLTVILEDNGFGKTTLAEFIRAMFYGFPRAAKSLDKNLRKKYTPWNGGTFGGNLIFEDGGKRYRIDRRFGATPKGDTFELTDARTHKRSSDYTANIGVELFGLDSESFARSTYMPQVHDSATAATNGIQSKLGDLVHDTNDINNFDKAIKTLREKRSGYLPYRGQGGTTAEAAARITELQEQIDQAEGQRPRLQQVLDRLEEVQELRSVKSGARESIQAEIRQRSQYEAKESAEKQLTAMENRKKQLERQQADLLRRRPRGLPAAQELRRIEHILGRLPALAPQPRTQTEQEAQETVDALADRFSAGLPETDLFTDLRELDRQLTQKEAELRSAALSEREQADLDKLERFFAPGVPEEDFHSRCRSCLRERTAAEDRLHSLSLPEADRLRLGQLEVFFGGSVPAEGELDSNQELLDRVSALRQENLRISAALEEQVRSEPAPEPAKSMVLPMLLGLILTVLGIGGVVLQYLVPGVIALALGVLLIAVGFALKLKQDVSRELRSAAPAGNPMTESDRERLRENTARIDDLEQQVTAFVARYITDNRPLQEKLSGIRSDRERYLELLRRRDDIATQTDALQQRTDKLTGELRGLLSPYFGSDTGYEQQLPLLQLRTEQYRALLGKREQTAARAARLTGECAALRQQLDDALTVYFPQGIGGSYGAAIAGLERDAQRCRTAADHLAEQRRLRQERAAEHEKLRSELADFAGRYAITVPLTEPEHFHQLRSDAEALPQLRQQVQQAAGELESFRREQARLLALPPRDDLRDPEVLQRSEALLTAELQKLEQEAAALEQQKRTLNTQLDAIAPMTDELEQCRQQRLQDLHSAELLDRTIEFLEQAREALSERYMGTVQSRFLGYMNRITGQAREQIFVTPELEVTMERLGEPRSMEYFSAGQTDIVTLCMRLALVDALFEDTTPLVILDDPFVNLDDGSLKQALTVLQELARDHQILYLVCNSSRSL